MRTRRTPFVLGTLADLSGNPTSPNPTALKDREFIEINRDNFNKIMRSIQPTLTLADVLSTLPGAQADEKLPVTLTFDNMDDFKPASIIQKVDVLKALYEERQRLRDLQSKLDSSDDLQQQLQLLAPSA
jgi:type VI secretion system ImpB/VipA family protein